MWLDASDLDNNGQKDADDGRADGSEVTQWVNKADSNQTFIIPTKKDLTDAGISSSNAANSVPDSNPTWISDTGSEANNQPAVYFLKSDKQNMLYDLAGNEEWSGEATIFVVFQQKEDGVSKDAFFSTGLAGTTGSMQVSVANDDKTFVSKFRDANGDVSLSFEPEAQNSLKLYAVKLDKGILKTLVDGKVIEEKM